MTTLLGFHPVREALRHRPQGVVRVLLAEERGGKRRREIEELCRRHGVPTRVVPSRELSGLGLGLHNGFAAEVGSGLEHRAIGDPDLVVLVEDVRDPRNLGALLRVCEAVGVGKVLVRDRGSAPLSPVAIRAAAGATEWLAVERVTNSARALDQLKRQGFWVYGAQVGGVPPWELELVGKMALCVGGEEKGLRRLTRDRCDGLIGLPMRGRLESLNLATAAAAVLYEAVRQRIRAGEEAAARSTLAVPRQDR